MSPTSRRAIAWTLGAVAAALYLGDLTGLKPPPRILPSVVLGGAAVLIGVTPRSPTGPVANRSRAMAAAGLLLHLLLLVPILPIGLIAPGAGVVVIHGIWVVTFIVAWYLRRSDPAIVLAIPFGTAAVLAGVVWLGTAVLGWQP